MFKGCRREVYVVGQVYAVRSLIDASLMATGVAGIKLEMSAGSREEPRTQFPAVGRVRCYRIVASGFLNAMGPRSISRLIGFHGKLHRD